jgi:hypothetical protein
MIDRFLGTGGCVPIIPNSSRVNRASGDDAGAQVRDASEPRLKRRPLTPRSFRITVNGRPMDRCAPGVRRDGARAQRGTNHADRQRDGSGAVVGILDDVRNLGLELLTIEELRPLA